MRWEDTIFTTTPTTIATAAAAATTVLLAAAITTITHLNIDTIELIKAAPRATAG